MSAGICIIAHEPLASALKTCAQHIFSATGDTHCDEIVCYDVPPQITAETGKCHMKELLDGFSSETNILIFTDILGATPSNIAHHFLNDSRIRVVAGVNLPALVTALSNINEPINRIMTLSEGAAHGGISSVIGNPSAG